MKAKPFIILALSFCLSIPWMASAGSVKPTITWDDASGPTPSAPVGIGFITMTTYGGDNREGSGFSGTFFSTVDAEVFPRPAEGVYSPASVFLIEPGSTSTLSDWIGIDSLSRVGATGGFLYTIDMRFVSDPVEASGADNNIPLPPDPANGWQPYPYVTETGLPQDITGNFRLSDYPGYRLPSGLTDLLQIIVSSDISEAPPTDGHGTPDGGSSLLLLGLAFSGVGLIKRRLKSVQI